MTICPKDFKTLRQLAGRYSQLARLDVQTQRLDRYRRSNGLEIVRPVVLINEVPWGEIHDQALTNTCAPEFHWLERNLRLALYQWEHFQGDMVIPPVFRIGKGMRSTGIGIRVQDTTIQGDTGAYISSHEYVDQLQTEDDLEKLKIPEISYDQAGTEARLAVAKEVFDGLMEVELSGHTLNCNIWDQIAAFRGVDALLMDLAMRPEFMHRTAQKFMEIAEAKFQQMEDLNLLDPDQILLHCTPACSDQLPAGDFNGKVRRKDVWGRCAAQIFGSVSPAMHDEFDLAYNQQIFGDCGLLYYGCCEPMDRKIDILGKRFDNLRKISITPWADPARAAEAIGADYVLAAKPNPALVSRPTFDPAPVKEEIARYCDVCRANNTPLEFVLKDISTIAKNPANLTRWSETVASVLDQYYG